MKIFVLLFALTGSLAHAEMKYVTRATSGQALAVFTMVDGPGKFGQAWSDPSGMIWSRVFGLYANEAMKSDCGGKVVESDATRICQSVGGRLPSNEDFLRLASYFETDCCGRLSPQGLEDLKTVFPDMLANDTWTSSVGEGYGQAHGNCGFTFGRHGFTRTWASERSELRPVRCVYDGRRD